MGVTQTSSLWPSPSPRSGQTWPAKRRPPPFCQHCLSKAREAAPASQAKGQMANGSALQTEQRLAPRLALRCGRKGDPRQYVNQRAWLCANETLFVDAEIGIPGRFHTSGNIILLFTFVSPTIWERKSHSSPTGCVGTGGWAGVGRSPGVQTPEPGKPHEAGACGGGRGPRPRAEPPQPGLPDKGHGVNDGDRPDRQPTMPVSRVCLSAQELGRGQVTDGCSHC